MCRMERLSLFFSVIADSLALSLSNGIRNLPFVIARNEAISFFFVLLTAKVPNEIPCVLFSSRMREAQGVVKYRTVPDREPASPKRS